ncbi:MarR family transcriptional regulator [Actinomycetospora sp. OC33-EN08]|uniref:MarR family transcriptional regulator n=1 Tax=Actinomycetospora aurantiaca TaxID=3129233 RepID=A0ABU8MJ35_9PSEU
MTQPTRTGARPRPSLLYAVKQVELIVRARLDELLRDSGVTALQYTALTVLAARDGLTSAELARNSFVTPQAMADLVTALERGEFIERHRNPDNRRQLLISLTPTGHALLVRYAEPVAAIEERMVEGLGPTDREQFRSYLNAARASLAQ